MTLASLPKFPPPLPTASTASRPASARLFSPRVKRILHDLAMLVILGVLLYSLRLTVAALETPPAAILPKPFDFSLVMESYDRKKSLVFMTRDDVEKLLGPPSEGIYDEPGLEELGERIKWSHRYTTLPPDTAWVWWVDPKNENKRVVVFFAGNKTYYSFKKGF